MNCSTSCRRRIKLSGGTFLAKDAVAAAASRNLIRHPSDPERPRANLQPARVSILPECGDANVASSSRFFTKHQKKERSPSTAEHIAADGAWPPRLEDEMTTLIGIAASAASTDRSEVDIRISDAFAYEMLRLVICGLARVQNRLQLVIHTQEGSQE